MYSCQCEFSLRLLSDQLLHLFSRRGGKGRGGGVRHIEAGKEAAIEAEMQASRERAVIPLETRVQQFMDMLTEKEVFFYYSDMS